MRCVLPFLRIKWALPPKSFPCGAELVRCAGPHVQFKALNLVARRPQGARRIVIGSGIATQPGGSVSSHFLFFYRSATPIGAQSARPADSPRNGQNTVSAGALQLWGMLQKCENVSPR